MRKFLTPAILALAVGFGASAASAATMTGKIEHVYPQHHRIMVSNHVFHMSPKTFQSARLRRGETVHINYHWSKDCSGNRCSSYRWATGVRAA
jgi:hypothetical protein